MEDLPSDDDVRRWLIHLRQPDLLAQTSIIDFLRHRGGLPTNQTGVELGRAAAAMLTESLERLKPAEGAPADEQLPYRVLQTCYLSGLKHDQAARRLGISARQLTRWRSRAIRLLADEVLRRPIQPVEAYHFTPIPAIIDFQARPAVTGRLRQCLSRDRYVHVHGPKGIGKTSLIAELALELEAAVPVLWYRFRPGINDSAATVMFEVAEHLHTRGRVTASDSLSRSLPTVDIGLMSRLLLRELNGLPLLFILDDYHLGEHDTAIGSFLDDVVMRISELRIITVGRHSDGPLGAGSSFVIPPMTRLETERLLAQTGVIAAPAMAEAIRRWTAGVPQLIRLAASWLGSATDAEVTRGLAAFNELDEVQDFLLGSIAELIDSADRAILDAASIFRRYFNDEALAFVAESTLGAVRDTSRRLVRSHVATRGRSGDVAFFHSSVREYFYERVPGHRRKELHRQAADWYDKHGPADEARHHRQLADAPCRTSGRTWTPC